MKINKAKSIILLNVIFIFFVSGSIVNQPSVDAPTIPFFTLELKIDGWWDYPIRDYAFLIKQHLARIGIEIDVIDESGFFNCLDNGFFDFDITIFGLGGMLWYDFFDLPNITFRENSKYNFYGYNTTMDFYDELGTGLNEWYIQKGFQLHPESDERIQHSWEWQDYIQSEILPMKPLFTPLNHVVYWNNLIGYNYTEGLRQSWGKMQWEGLHQGQSSTSEIAIKMEYLPLELNPFFCKRRIRDSIYDYCLDRLIVTDLDLSTWPMLAESWKWVNDSTLDIKIRNEVKWADNEGFTDEFLDVDDVYFSLCLKKLYDKYYDYFWLIDMEKIDDMTIRLYIDGNPNTPEHEPYVETINNLNTFIVPEHFLNQTQLVDGVTPDVSHQSWIDYSTNMWGTNILQIENFTKRSGAILTKNNLSWHYNDTITSDPALDYVRRFGDYKGGLEKLIVRQKNYDFNFGCGKLDLLDLHLYHYKLDKFRSDSSKIIQSKIDSLFYFICFNLRENRDYIGSREPCPLDPTITKGLALRKAISYAIDRVEINQIIRNTDNLIWDYPNKPTLGYWLNPNIIRYNFDLDKAKEYMTKAGFDLGWTPIQPGFTIPITITSLFAIVTIGYFTIKQKKIKNWKQ